MSLTASHPPSTHYNAENVARNIFFYCYCYHSECSDSHSTAWKMAYRCVETGEVFSFSLCLSVYPFLLNEELQHLLYTVVFFFFPATSNSLKQPKKYVRSPVRLNLLTAGVECVVSSATSDSAQPGKHPSTPQNSERPRDIKEQARAATLKDLVMVVMLQE